MTGLEHAGPFGYWSVALCPQKRNWRPSPMRTTRSTMPAEIPTADEVRALLDACAPRSAVGVRNRALIAVLYRAGLRAGEALALRETDVGDGLLRVRRGKGGRSRTVGIDGGALVMLREWLGERRERGLGAAEFVFCTMRGSPLTASYLRVLLPRLATRAGVRRRVHAHGLRHAHASELRAEGVDVAIISRQLGHRSLLTTIRYLDHIAPVRVIEAIAARTWSGSREESSLRRDTR